MRTGKRSPRPGSNLIIPAILFVVVSLCSAAYAQSTSSIEGKVTDQNGAVVPGAEIIARNSAIGIHRKATADLGGRYQIASLAAADYRIEVRAEGFQKQIVKSVSLEVGRTITQNFKLPNVLVTGQVGFQTGPLKVGLPGAPEGLKARDLTIAELLKAQGYKTGKFGKNHLGDRDEHLPTGHGFELRRLQDGDLVLAQSAQKAPVSTAVVDQKAWSFSASVFTYLLPDESNYAQPTFTADRDWLHLEARYNYEDLHTGSVWLGYNFSFGDEVGFDFTPIFGVVFGDTDGVAPGYKAALRWRKLDLSSESEYVFDAGDSSESFLYTWSELGWSPVDWLRLGLVVQRTKVYETEFDAQRGFLVGVAYKNASFTTYVFNPDASQPTVVLGISLNF